MLAHGLFLVVLAAAVTVRWIATLGYPTVLWFGDSRTYLEAALQFKPADLRPSGYSVFLWMLKPLHSFLWVVGVQHALGIAIGVMVYALVWRAARAALSSRSPRWTWLPGVPAALCTLPVLFDAYQVQLEHLLMADLLFTFLLVAAVTMVLWRQRMRWWAGALAGLLVSFAALARSVGLPLLLVIIICMLIRRSGWRPIVAAFVACAIPVIAYMSWFDSVHGKFAMTTTDQIWLYGRTVDFAKCDVIKPRPEVAILCRDRLPRTPGVAPAYVALWGGDSGFHKLPGWVRDPKANELAGEFAWGAIKKQPGDYIRVVLRDTFRAFEWERKPYPAPWTASSYRFREGASLKEKDATAAYPYGGRTAEVRVVEPYGGWMRDYQSRVFMPGTFLGGLLLIGLGGILVRARRGGGEAFLPWSVSLALLVVPAATADFDYRYVLPAVPFAALAAGLAVVPGRRKPPQSPEQPPSQARLPEAARRPLLLSGTPGTLPRAADGTDQPLLMSVPLNRWPRALQPIETGTASD